MSKITDLEGITSSAKFEDVVFSFGAFLEFARSKPTEEVYTPYNDRKCPLAQFLGHKAPNDLHGAVGNKVADAIYGNYNLYQTWGQLVERLESLEA